MNCTSDFFLVPFVTGQSPLNSKFRPDKERLGTIYYIACKKPTKQKEKKKFKK